MSMVKRVKLINAHYYDDVEREINAFIESIKAPYWCEVGQPVYDSKGNVTVLIQVMIRVGRNQVPIG